MTENFKKLLVSIHKKPLQDQKKALEKHFEKWRGEHEQVDDILVLGIKL